MPTNISIKGIPDDVYQKLKLQAEKILAEFPAIAIHPEVFATS